MDFIDYYSVLGVSKTASQEEIDRAYRKMARQYHPDVSKAKDAEERFKKVNEAYQVLRDPKKRQVYDRYGAAWKDAERQGGPAPGFDGFRTQPGGGGFQFEFGEGGDLGDFSDFFRELFGLGGGPARGGRRGRTGARSGFGGFEEVLSGAGRGRRTGGRRAVTGGADQEARLALDLAAAARGGRQEFTLRDPQTGQMKTVAVRIPRGVRTGQRIRLAGLGAPDPSGGPAGDLYLEVEIAPHALFELDGADLHTVLPITPWTAALGGDAILQTLEGSVKVKIPAGSASGRKIRLAGRGFPTGAHDAGDLYAELRIVVPAHLSATEREHLEKLAALSAFTPPSQHAPGKS